MSCSCRCAVKYADETTIADDEEEDGLRAYYHIGTGNYNAKTAGLYTDLGLFSCDPEIGADLMDLFNYLTGYSRQTVYRKLLVAPVNMRQRFLELIDVEISHAVAVRLEGRLAALGTQVVLTRGAQADRGDGTSAAGGTRTVTTEPMREQTSANGQVQAALDEEAQPGTVASLPFQLKKEDTAKNNADSVVPASAMDIDHVSHAVSANELSSNMSTASESIRSTAFGATRHKVDALKDKQRASTDASDIRLAASSDEGDRTGTDLIGLLKAAW